MGLAKVDLQLHTSTCLTLTYMRTCTDVGEVDSTCLGCSSALETVVAVTTPLCRAPLVTTGVLITTEPELRTTLVGSLAE